MKDIFMSNVSLISKYRKKAFHLIAPIVIFAMTLMLTSCNKTEDDSIEASNSNTVDTSASYTEDTSESRTVDKGESNPEDTSEEYAVDTSSASPNDITTEAQSISVSDKTTNPVISNNKVSAIGGKSSENELATAYSSYFLGHDSDTYKANCPGIISADFVVLDTKHNYDTGFECWIEGYDTKKGWYKLKPIGEIVQVNSGSGAYFYNINEDATRCVNFDLACYPLLPAGKYRIAKPFWDEGSTNHEQYIVYYEFEMVDNLNTGNKITENISCTQFEYPVNTAQIKLKYDGILATSEIFDIEKKVGANWQSVRTGSVKTNSIGGSYPLLFSDVIDTDGFDLSKTGEYRLRFSVGEMTSNFDFLSNYDTKYAYFKITDTADIGDISISCSLDDICEIDKQIPVDVTSFVNSSAKLTKAVLTVGGKTIVGDGNLSLSPNSSTFNFYDTSTYDSNSIDETIISFKENLPVGNAELKLTFSSEGCKDKIVTTKFKIRKATNDEKNSGVFVTAKDSGLSPDKITVKITNKCRNKKAIYIDNGTTYIYTVVDGETIYAYMADQSDNNSLKINYGDTAEFVLINYGKDLKNYCKTLPDLSNEDSEYIDELIKELEEDEYFKYYCLAKAGTYTVSINYYDDNYNTDNSECSFKVK